MKKWQLYLALVAVSIFASAGVSHAQKPKFEKTWRVYFSTMVYQHNWQGKVIQNWAKEIEDRTNGALKIQLYWPGQLPYKGFEIFTTVQNRLVDGAECLTTYYGSTHPLMDIRWMTFTIDNLDQFKKVIQGVMRKYYQPIYEKYNVIPVINTTSGGDQNWFSKDAVTKMEQIKGNKCRVYSKATADMVKAWGCHPVTIPIVELYTALQRGVVTSVVTSFTTGADVKFWEVLPYATDMNWSMGGYNTVLINGKAWAELPADVQKIVLEAGERASEEIFKESPAEEKRLRDLFRKGGAKVIQLDPGEREKLKKASLFLVKEWVDMNGNTAVEMLKEVKKVAGIDIMREAGL
jgi:TRAP-type C4-dicarboxylate transport system substrate-binding protein